jgi:hypothetical protein
MSVQTPRREPLAVPPDAQARTRAGTTLHAPVDRPGGIRPAKANCGSCGEAWFGDVTYCPYCGRPSASAPVPITLDTPSAADSGSDGLDGPTHAPAGHVRSSAGTMRAGTMRLSGAPPGGGTEQPGMRWKRWAKPIALATVFAAFVFAAGELAGPAPDRAGPKGAASPPAGDAARSGTVETSAGVAASAPAVPRADTEPTAQQLAPAPAPTPAPAPAPPARNRSLCSAASEAAGLCNPQ